MGGLQVSAHGHQVLPDTTINNNSGDNTGNKKTKKLNNKYNGINQDSECAPGLGNERYRRSGSERHG